MLFRSLLGVNLAKAALGEEPFNPRASPMPAVASASAAVPAPIAIRPPTYKESLAIAIPVEKPKEDKDDEDDDTEQNDDGFKKIEYKKSRGGGGGGGSQVNIKTCWFTDAGKHCHNADCKHTHPELYQPGPRTICINWKKGACKWGEDCNFLHAKKCPYEDGPNFKEEK